MRRRSCRERCDGVQAGLGDRAGDRPDEPGAAGADDLGGGRGRRRRADRRGPRGARAARRDHAQRGERAVRGARAGFVHAEDAVDTYKWMVNGDDTGDPGTAADPGTQPACPRAPKVAAPTPTSRTPARGPRSATPPVAPIVAQGDQATSTRTEALSGLEPGKYLISVTAKASRSTAQHFTVTRAPPAVAVAMNPTPLPLAPSGSRCSTTTSRSTPPTRRTPSAGLAGFTAHLTDVFGEVSVGLLRQPTVHGLRHRGRPGRPAILFDATAIRSSTRHLDRQVHERRQRRDRDPEPRPEPLRRDGGAAGR